MRRRETLTNLLRRPAYFRAESFSLLLPIKFQSEFTLKFRPVVPPMAKKDRGGRPMPATNRR
jgi:hypothetical protein